MQSHLDIWGTAAVAALSAVLLNNLPAASLLAARPPVHPFALLIGPSVEASFWALDRSPLVAPAGA